MATYAITFRLEEDPGRERRYRSLMEAIRVCTVVWAEPTSFCLVETDETLDELEERLYFDTELDASKDILMVIQVTYDAAIARGAIKQRRTLEGRFALALTIKR